MVPSNLQWPHWCSVYITAAQVAGKIKWPGNLTVYFHECI